MRSRFDHSYCFESLKKVRMIRYPYQHLIFSLVALVLSTGKCQWLQRNIGHCFEDTQELALSLISVSIFCFVEHASQMYFERTFEDVLWCGLTDSYIKTPMGMTAEKLGAQYKVSRADADAFALRSQTLWKKAQDAGHFKEEITPVTVKVKRKEMVFEVDEHPRPTTAESLAKLPPVFQKDGLVNAGNASGVSDGAAALVVAGEDSVAKYGLKPLTRVVAWHSVGVDPTIMGIGPAPAIRGLLEKTKLKLNDIDLIEVNEAFAPQAVAVQRELGIPDKKLNVNGGAIALGHPLGASGARISAHLVHEMKRRNVKYGIGSACIGGGQGIAILFENLQ